MFGISYKTKTLDSTEKKIVISGFRGSGDFYYLHVYEPKMRTLDSCYLLDLFVRLQRCFPELCKSLLRPAYVIAACIFTYA